MPISEANMPVVKLAEVTIQRSDYLTTPLQRAAALSMAVSIKPGNGNRHGALAGTGGGQKRGRRHDGVERTPWSLDIATVPCMGCSEDLTP